MKQQPTDTIITVIKSLPPDLQTEVGHYADFLRARYLHAKRAGEPYGEWTDEEVTQASLKSLWKIWDNDEDAIYDNL